ncbi:transcription termination factor NusA [Magnetofaba australis]|uniref:Transcription termination/antitermination protein NusA n=1 Tax=Magnetofaba australis IT-1 TaxID=1434232 RepID=A0A1Y2K2E7_9PROT|nr:transcription termination factor NusA [Magnetofaba australis]OSM00362.1 putative NusA antitermination factor [Magnetofaba australis IT-1]
MTIEILQVAEQVAREKGIDKQVVIDAMEIAIQTASRKKYGANKNIQARFDPKSGEFLLHQLREVVAADDEESLADTDLYISIEDALRLNPEAQLGDFIAEALPPIEFGRIAAQTAKQVIVQKVRDAERERIFEEYIDRQGQLVNGLVKRVERNNIHVDLGRTSAFLPYEEQLPREHYRPGDRIRAYIKEVRDATRGPQIILSRTHAQMVARLFEMEVPEIYDAIVEIKAVARDPGFRSKIAVRSNDSHVDPVGACVGMRGSRVQGVVTELQGERIDIIEWSPDPAVFVCNALAPAEVFKVVVDEEERNIKVVVLEDQLSLAIGRRGQNVRLASELTGWKIDIITEAEEISMRAEEFEELAKHFMQNLDLDEDVAAVLVQEGFSSSEEVAYVPLEELASIDGFDEDIAQELRNRARDQLLQQALKTEERKEELHVDPRLSELEGLNDEALILLAEKEIKTLDDFADLATDELQEYLDNGVNEEQAAALILDARRKAGWFDDEEEQESAPDAAS